MEGEPFSESLDLRKNMKAAVVRGPNQIEASDVPDPVIGEYDVLCKVLYASVCSGTDNHIVANDAYFDADYPLILGHEGIGRVVKLGARVRNIQIGDVVTRVFNRLPSDSGFQMKWGAFAEYAVATDWQAMRDDGLDQGVWTRYRVHRVLPASIEPMNATMVITWRETKSFLDRLELKKGDTVIIIGSGANARALSDHIKNLGGRCLVVGSSKREHLFSHVGLVGYISYRDPELVSKVKDLVGADLVDGIIDAVGDDATANSLLPFMKDAGPFGLYGLNNWSTYALNITLAQGDIRFFSGEQYDEASAHDVIIKDITQGNLNASDYISKSHVYSLDQIDVALEASQGDEVFKAVIDCSL